MIRSLCSQAGCLSIAKGALLRGVCMFYVYILRCEDGSLYTGITSDPRRRFAEHLMGDRGAKYTRMRRPKEPAALWAAGTHRAAASLEWRIKRLSRVQKLALLSDPSCAAALLPPGAWRVASQCSA